LCLNSNISHSGFFFLMRIRKKKTGIHESSQGIYVILWIPVFFGRIDLMMMMVYR